MTDHPFPIEYMPGSTPLDPDELLGLIPNYISTQGELNVLEQGNILEAKTWMFKKKPKEYLTDTFMIELHKRMFKNVWKWAGRYRLTDKSIGVHWQQIPVQMSALMRDTQYWIENNTYSWDEIGARFHHKMVAIHAFPNGNGRHARLATEIVQTANDQEPFTWGAKTYSESLDQVSALRNEYINALREADQRKFDRLIRFVRM
ncbi:MAG TPA: mobile mystery protein B [Oligoflexus sp.]|uniref:mobile mystery protein B n=1 Tax=Oligoflexus sp. TaxID=1971216 RepID=UPI002D744A03|nr:mobile mystery protein B [Oligoflexus sp.]HYX32019.1 mobile mystery protein B [Oligoflexus sp.]